MKKIIATIILALITTFTSMNITSAAHHINSNIDKLSHSIKVRRRRNISLRQSQFQAIVKKVTNEIKDNNTSQLTNTNELDEIINGFVNALFAK